MASTDSSQSSDDVADPSPSYFLPSYNTSKHSNRNNDPNRPGPSNWCQPPDMPFTSRSNRRAMAASKIDRSNTSSPSSESSIGDSRSPDVLWRDGNSSSEGGCGGNIPTRMFSNTSQRKRAYPEEVFHYYSHAKLMHKNDSCVSDMSESSPDSANSSSYSPKDESNTSGNNGHRSSDQEKQEKISQATFDKVLIDANQRRHIRNKARNAGTDSGSDSSSGNMCLNRGDVVGTSASAAMKMDSTTSESSGIGANYMSSAQCDLMLPRSRSTIMPGAVTNSSTGVSTMYNSQGNKVSDESKQESMSSGSSGARKRHIPWSIARYYYQTKQHNISQEESIDGEVLTSQIPNSLNKRIGQPERKRKRFHRTFTALRQCGLLDLTMQTASLMEQNTKLQKQLGELHRQAHLMYHTVSHFSKIQPNAFGSSEAQKIIDGLKDMVDKNPVGEIDMSMFESTSGSRDSPAIESGAFTLSNQIPSLSADSSLKSADLRKPCTSTTGSPANRRPLNSSDSAIQSSITTTSTSSDKSGTY